MTRAGASERRWDLGVAVRLVAVTLAWALALGACDRDSSKPAGGGPVTDERDFISRALQVVTTTSEPWTMVATAEPLAATDTIQPAEGSSDYQPEGPYYFAMVDQTPRARFEHPVTYVYVDAQSGKVTTEEQQWWPELNGEALAMAKVKQVKLFAPGPAPAAGGPPPPPGAGAGGGRLKIIWAFYPDTAGKTVTARLLVDLGDGMSGFFNAVADLDGDGSWNDGQAGNEWLLQNDAVPEGAKGSTWTGPFVVPVDADAKFPSHYWARVAVTAQQLPAKSWDGGCDPQCRAHADGYFDLDGWTGPGCDAKLVGIGCQNGVPGPRKAKPEAPAPAPKTGCSYVCKPDEISIDAGCKALVINLGDRPGESAFENEMTQQAAFFESWLGAGTAQTMDMPTASDALSAIEAFVKSLSCLDEAHLYIMGHGYKSGGIWVRNGKGKLTPEQLHDAITSAQHCPAQLTYDTAKECKQPGYCNLNVTLISCYSGNFINGGSGGKGSLDLPGLNVLAAASADRPAYGTNGGAYLGQAYRDAFTNNQGDANGDGVTTNAEAVDWAKQNVEKGPAGKFDSKPQSTHNADCTCTCESTTPPPSCDMSKPLFTDASAVATDLGADAKSGCKMLELIKIIHSMLGMAEKLVAHDHTTIAASIVLRQTLAALLVTQLFNNTDYPCGQGTKAYTLCPSPQSVVPAGDFIVVFNVLEQAIPDSDPANIYQYGFVFDADGNPANNYQPSAQYPNDFFKGTDRWYEATYQPGTGWAMKVTDYSSGAPQSVASNARIIRKGNVLVLVAPASEFAAAKPSYRVTAFRHTGDYGVNPPYNWDGSVWPAVADGLAPLP